MHVNFIFDKLLLVSIIINYCVLLKFHLLISCSVSSTAAHTPAHR